MNALRRLNGINVWLQVATAARSPHGFTATLRYRCGSLAIRARLPLRARATRVVGCALHG